MGNFVTAVAHLIMAIGEFGYKNPSFIELNKLELNFINRIGIKLHKSYSLTFKCNRSRIITV